MLPNSPVRPKYNLTQKLLHLHDAGVGADVVDGLLLALIRSLLENLVVGLILLSSGHLWRHCIRFAIIEEKAKSSV